MKPEVRRLYKEAKANKVFDREMLQKDPEGYYRPNMFSPTVAKCVYAAVYYGWLMARGEYKRENYE